MPVIDQHDDLCQLFRDHGPKDGLEFLKTASWRERDDLLDRDFAVIVVDGAGKEHRKFACYDAGNLFLSQWYLLNAEHSLPSGVVKVAAANMLQAAEDLHIPTHPALALLASEGDRLPGDGRRVFVKSASASSYAPVSPLEPSQLVPLGRGMSVMAGTSAVKEGSAYDALSVLIREWNNIDPYERHEAAVDIVKVASGVGMMVPDHIAQYSGTSLNPRFEKIANMRAEYTAIPQLQQDYRRLAKMAAALDPDDVVEALFLLDEQAGLLSRYGTAIPDPLLSVFGVEKQAQYSWTSGGDYVNASMLLRFSGSPPALESMEEIFDEEVVSRFKTNPIETFKKMPPEQQIIVARLASQSGESNNGGY